jgi:hypothetical protein
MPTFAAFLYSEPYTAARLFPDDLGSRKLQISPKKSPIQEATAQS